MTLVVDASVAVKWFVPEEGRDEALALLDRGEPLIAPDLIFAEVANIFWKKVRRGEIKTADAQRALSAVAENIDQSEPMEAFASRALEIAEAIDHPAYDCFYLALAERSRAPLATFDTRLRRRVAGSAFDHLLAPALA